MSPQVDEGKFNLDVAEAAIHTLNVGDGSLNIACCGTGLPMILLHGWTLDWRIWIPQMPLGRALRLIMPDRRGFGRSTAPPALAREFKDIEAIASVFELDSFILVGLSQGASVALDYARRHPDRVAALALLGAPLHSVLPIDPSQDIPRDHYAQLIRDGELEEMKAEWQMHPLVQTAPEGQALLRDILADYDGRDQREPSDGIDIKALEISHLDMPLLAMTGTSDMPWRKMVAGYLAEATPRGKFQLIENAGHLCNLDNPETVNRALASLIARI